MNLNGGMRVIKQSATAWGVADYCALIGIIFGWGFWTNLYLALYIPTTLPTQAVTIIGAGLHAFAMPVLWSALLPTTAAGQLLQKTKWRTFGFSAVVAFAVFLTVIAAYLMFAWQSAQVNVKASNLAYYMTIVWLILTVGVPALAFVQVTPEQWLKQVQQWQMVQRLEMQHKTDLILAREAYGRAMIILRLGLDRATLEQRQYVAGVWSGLHKAEQYNLRAIAETLHDDGLSAQAIDPDAGEIGQGITRIAMAIEGTANEADDIMASPLRDSVARHAVSARAVEGETILMERVLTPSPPRTEAGRGGAGNPAPPQFAAVRRSSPQFAAEYEAARAELRGVWSATDLARVIGKSERTARDRMTAWEADGLIGHDVDSRAAYYFTESEAT